MLSSEEPAHLPSSTPSSQARESDLNVACHTHKNAYLDTPPGTCHAASLALPSHCHGPDATSLTPIFTKVEEQTDTSATPVPHASPLSVVRTTAAQEDATNQGGRQHRSAEEEEVPATAEQLAAATKIQAAFRGYSTRRDLFSGPILTGVQKWKYLCLYSRLNTRVAPARAAVTSTANALQDDVEEQQDEKEEPKSPQEKHARLWTRMMFLTSQLGKGFNAAPSEEALVLLTEHWLEMSDKKHRYGSNLKPYHERWLREETNEDFFEWLDNGSGKDLSLEERPRVRLESELVQYLQEHEREKYAVSAKGGLLYYRDSGELVHTLPDSVKAEDEVDISQILPDANANDDEHTRLEKKKLRNRTKYIYVLDPRGVLYIGRKVKGKFHHSSFFGGGTVCAAGGIVVNRGRVIKVNPKSGHYRPGQMHFDRLLRTLHEMGIPMDNVKICTGIFEQADG